MNYTTNLNLKKPTYFDTPDIQDINDNFDIIDKQSNQIGDIILTKRTELSDDWLFCNGDVIDLKQYPKLSGKLLEAFGAKQKTLTISTLSSNISVSKIIYADNKFAAVGTYMDKINSTNVNIGFVAYTSNPDGEWTIKNIWDTNGINKINDIIYANSYWVIAGVTGSNPIYGTIAYSTSLDGEWTTKKIGTWGGVSPSACSAITYANGYWVIAGQKRINSNSDCITRIGYTTNIEEDMVFKDLWKYSGEQYTYISDIMYANGYWVVSGSQWQGKSPHPIVIAYSANLENEWTIKEIWSTSEDSTQSQNLTVYTITYINGYWIVTGRQKENQTWYACIAYSTSLEGEWAIKKLWKNTITDSSSDSTYCSVQDIIYANGYWVVVGQQYLGKDYDNKKFWSSRIAYTTNLNSTWIIKDAWIGNNYYNFINTAVYANKYFVSGGAMNLDDGVYRAQIAYNSDDDVYLPEISLDAHAYIKGR